MIEGQLKAAEDYLERAKEAHEQGNVKVAMDNLLYLRHEVSDALTVLVDRPKGEKEDDKDTE